ncbi:MAG: hypothetical protein MPK62_12205 [Alphaproteobacteria bacterium]|nr:hypothetical protein [Alphaproteobacteria bacterium]
MRTDQPPRTQGERRHFAKMEAATTNGHRRGRMRTDPPAGGRRGAEPSRPRRTQSPDGRQAPGATRHA